MEEKVIRETYYCVKAFKKVKIGDPIYFDEIAKKGKNSKRLKELTCNFKIPTENRTNEVVIRKIQCNDDGFIYNSYDLFICSREKEDILAKAIIDMEFKGKYAPNLLKSQHTLGCDTARFTIEINQKRMTINTGADGYFGYAHQYKDNKAYFIQLSLDDDMVTWKDMENLVEYLFDVNNRFMIKK